MIIIGLHWFIAALVVFGLHAASLLDWRREARERLAQWKAYDEGAERRHQEFMAELRRARSGQQPRERAKA